MPDIKERKVKIVEVFAGNENIIQEEEIIREATEDEASTEEIEVRRYPELWCGHHRPVGFRCHCGNRFCRDCYDSGRVWYCEKCGKTLGPCCYRKRYDARTLCEDCWEIDLEAPVAKTFTFLGIVAMIFLSLFIIKCFGG